MSRAAATDWRAAPPSEPESDVFPVARRSDQGRAGEPACRVLVVDDDADHRDILAMHLQAMGFEVEQASDGEEGVAKAIAWIPDAIVTDYAMPRADGGHLAQLVAASDRTRGIPVVILSAMADTIPPEARGPCAALLAKPCSAEALGTLLRTLIDARRGEGQAGSHLISSRLFS